MNRPATLLPLLLLAAAAAPLPLARAQAPATEPPVRCGVDVLVHQGGEPLNGRKVGLITNHTGVALDGRRTIDVLQALPGIELRAIFSPEHGIHGALDQSGIAHGEDEATGLPIWSLYGETRKPTAEMLQGLDTLVFDIQDIGCRFYTYVSTMGNALEAAAEHGLRFVVLDRPNPIDGEHMAGPILDAGKEAFVGWHTIPLRHGMTAGELMRLFQGERGIRVDAQVVPCEGWRRADTWDRTGLPWIDPSPNMRSLTEALLYPGIGLLEGTNLSVGRGTDTPFERIGAPWCDGVRLAARLRAAALPGVAFVPIRFTPDASKFKDEECGGVQIAITDWAVFEPVGAGIAVACALRDLFPDWNHDRLQWLLRDDAAYAAFVAGGNADDVAATWRKELELFRMRRAPFLLYP
ncbi:MAG: exo-beta-N-acetylmuramidase NamZ domain-containing protein [Planctomycetota bacterium]